MSSQGIKPNKRLGQVFLKNKRFIKKIISALEIKENEIIIEIGPGTGILTEALLQTKAKVIAIEKDNSLCQFLKEKFKDYPNFEIIEGDVRNIMKSSNNQDTNSKQIPNFKFQILDSDYKLVGNIPYYLTSYLFRLLIDLEKKPQLVVLMVQKEVALRINAKPPKMNLLAALVQTFFKIEIVCFVSKSNFWPIPKVDSAIIKMIPLASPFKNKEEKEKFLKLVKAGFSQPRKLLATNLLKVINLKKERLKLLFEKINMQPNTRAQVITIKQWFSLWKLVKNYLN